MDILLHQTANGGDFSLKGNDLETTESIFNAIYLALFGGNFQQTEDQYNEGDRLYWWGNSVIDDQPAKMNSETENALRNNALNAAGRRSIIEAAKIDLGFLQEISDIEVSATITTAHTLSLFVSLTQTGDQFKFVWDNTRGEVIEYTIIE